MTISYLYIFHSIVFHCLGSVGYVAVPHDAVGTWGANSRSSRAELLEGKASSVWQTSSGDIQVDTTKKQLPHSFQKKNILIKTTFFLRISCWIWFFSLRPSVQAHSMSQTQATKWQFCSLRVWCVRVWSTHTRTANTKIIQLACNLESECIWSDLMRNFVLFSGATIWFSENWMRIWEMHRMAF